VNFMLFAIRDNIVLAYFLLKVYYLKDNTGIS
jgi:hypothetical protein